MENKNQLKVQNNQLITKSEAESKLNILRTIFTYMLTNISKEIKR